MSSRPLGALLAVLAFGTAPGGCQEPPPEGCIYDDAGDLLCAWPAEPPEEAVNLTSIEGKAPNDFYENLSGASWSEDTQTLWVARNGPGTESKVWALEDDGAGGFQVREQDGARAEWTHFGDLEALTRIEGDDPYTVYLLVEGEETIESWDLSDFRDDHPLKSWDLSEILPYDAAHGAGAEGLAFLPDSVARRFGFVGGDGTPATSHGGLGGLFLVGHQNGGQVYAFDLDAEGDTSTLVGVFDTYGGETAALELDPDAGLLYLWHAGGDDVLEVTELTSTPTANHRRLDTRVVYTAPEGGGDVRSWEGLALLPGRECAEGLRDLFMTVDDGGDESLLWFSDFPCP